MLRLPHKSAVVPEIVTTVYDMELIILSQLLPNSRDKAWERSTFVKVWRLKQGARPADLPPRMLRGLGVAWKADPRGREVAAG